MTALAQADAARLPLRDESVDLIVTSPPYFALRSYRDGDQHYAGQIGSEPSPQAFVEALWAVTRELWRVLKPTGSLFVNLGDKYAGSGGHNNNGLTRDLPGVGKQYADGEAHVRAARRNGPDRYIQEAGGIRDKSLMGLPWRYANGCIDGEAGPGRQRWVLRAEIVWDKPNGMPESVGDRVRRSHEQWFHLTREGDYFANVDDIREPHAPVTRERSAAHRAAAGRAMREGLPYEGTNQRPHTFALEHMVHPKGKLPGSVWRISTDPLVIPPAARAAYDLPVHFAAFPQEWPRRFVLGWSPEGGTVLDPFSGSGTVVGVAQALGRRGVGIDLSHDYCRLGRWRVERSGHFGKAASRTDAERQGSLLGEAG